MKIKIGDKNIIMNNINNYKIKNENGNSIISNNNFLINNKKDNNINLNNENSDKIKNPEIKMKMNQALKF